MQSDLREEYARIGQERDAAARIDKRERFWFWARVVAICWGWTILGAVVMAKAFRINAYAGPFVFPETLELAKLWLQGGLLIGTGGSLGTLIWSWRAAAKRGYFD